MGYRLTFYEDKAGKWRWRFVADNGNIMAISSQGYVNKDDCLHCAEIVLATNYEVRA